MPITLIHIANSGYKGGIDLVSTLLARKLGIFSENRAPWLDIELRCGTGGRGRSPYDSPHPGRGSRV